MKTNEENIKKDIKRQLNGMSGEIERFYTKIKSIDMSNVSVDMSKEEEIVFSALLKEVKKEWDDI
jgi:predicted metal-dependent hydrolase